MSGPAAAPRSTHRAAAGGQPREGIADEALHETQPAISKLVRNLEESLGLTSFDRRAYRAQLQEERRRFFPRAAAWLEGGEPLKSYARALCGAQEDLVRVAVGRGGSPPPLVEALRLVQHGFPSAAIAVKTERLEGALQALSDEEVDLAVAPITRAHHLEQLSLPPVAVVPVACATHELASLEGEALRVAQAGGIEGRREDAGGDLSQRACRWSSLGRDRHRGETRADRGGPRLERLAALAPCRGARKRHLARAANGGVRELPDALEPDAATGPRARGSVQELLWGARTARGGRHDAVSRRSSRSSPGEARSAGPDADRPPPRPGPATPGKILFRSRVRKRR